ncbi:hypothetical protein [Fluviicola sp.]|uniref:hypothetical protein n=1 Tax=Fluviicola sp. TaxID=1917219 RepID=UPI0031CF68A1
MNRIHLLLLLLPFGILFSCTDNKTEHNLMTGERKFIEGLGILDQKEQIQLFENNDGFDDVTKSGNFITDKRIAAYWIKDGNREIYSAFFTNEIDSIAQTDNHTALTYASYLTVYKTDGSSFNVYVDADSTRTYEFFNKALSNWEALRKNK